MLLIAGAASFYLMRHKEKGSNGERMEERKPTRGTIQLFVSTTGTVLPKNRLEVKPPVNGRLDELLVQEGEKVKSGQTIAWLSSTERAALLDAARGKGEETLKYWQDVYKPIPLISPIDGEVIVAKTQPGQTITTSDAVIVLSDHLIVRAQVDETDIGKIKQGQEAVLTLDAYPQKKIKGHVEHIYYESKTVNNVTMYEVDVIPEEVFEFFRSGMNTSLDFKEVVRENVLLIPEEAVIREKGQTLVTVKDPQTQQTQRRRVELGISDNKNIEIVSGLTENDIIMVKSNKYSLPKNNIGSNPFMPRRR